MISAGTAGLIGLTILGTSFLSGIFGMAGGMILLGVLLSVLDVPAAMVLFGVTQFGANGWRCWLWRRHVHTRIVTECTLGAVAVFFALKLVDFVPGKALVYIGLGLTPFLVEMLPMRFRPDIERRGAPAFCGALIMAVQTFAGVSGAVLDVFFQNGGMDRKAIVATKAAIQSIGHLLRIVYFGGLAIDEGFPLPPEALVAALAVAFVGTSLAARVLERMTEGSFRTWSRRLILGVSALYVLRGLFLIF
jgi:uncharacterized membrane protein YfcA